MNSENIYFYIAVSLIGIGSTLILQGLKPIFINKIIKKNENLINIVEIEKINKTNDNLNEIIKDEINNLERYIDITYDVLSIGIIFSIILITCINFYINSNSNNFNNFNTMTDNKNIFDNNISIIEKIPQEEIDLVNMLTNSIETIINSGELLEYSESSITFNTILYITAILEYVEKHATLIIFDEIWDIISNFLDYCTYNANEQIYTNLKNQSYNLIKAILDNNVELVKNILLKILKE